MECDVIDDVTGLLRGPRVVVRRVVEGSPGNPRAGMECDVIDDVTGSLRGPRVVVRRVVEGSPAERASGGSRGVETGDEILSLNGVRLATVSVAEIRQFVAETPLTVALLVRRRVQRQQTAHRARSLRQLAGAR